MNNPTASDNLVALAMRLGELRDVLTDEIGQPALGSYVHDLTAAVYAIARQSA